MFRYRTPVDDIMFVLADVLDVSAILRETGRWPDIGDDDIRMIVTEAGRFCEERIHPWNHRMGEEGCRLTQGRVSTPTGMKEIYRDFAADGWMGLCAEAEHGGQGLPRLLHFVLMELLSSSCLAFSDYVGTFCSAYEMVRKYGDEQCRRLYLESLARGVIGGAQCMTEPHCGTDMSLCSTRAEKRSDGSYAITGTKIFISGGDQDLTGNIVHIVLARVPEDGGGNRGLSLFLVPKFLPHGTGHADVLNGVTCTHLEHKMGYAAQATCQLSFEGARGWLMGERGKGLGAMFTMVNEARLSVGCQGFSVATAAYQYAAQYAKERLQGRAAKGRLLPDKPADPIIVHPDVRRMLLSSRSFAEAARATYYWLGLECDRASHHPDPGVRAESASVLALLTSVFKAIATDFGYQAANDSMQIFGGHGYVRETGIEHYVRDCRVTQIYEGANGMLAADLLKRFVLNPDFDGFARFVDRVRSDIGRLRVIGELDAECTAVSDALDLLAQATEWIRSRGLSDADEIGAAGIDYQRILGLTLFAWMWLRMMGVATRKAGEATGQEKQFYVDKLFTGRFFLARILPACHAHWRIMQAGSATLMGSAIDYY